jgi:hypothetical protein
MQWTYFILKLLMAFALFLVIVISLNWLTELENLA